ncbi:MAG: DUF2892 domain-containing protein [Anaerolineae bacterium]|nr:DUF2892 domain-containing protein [Anaerolineae bacterium]
MSFINESTVDRIVRVVIGLALIALGWSGMIQGALGTVVLVVGFVPLLTGLIGFCPLYTLFGLRTNKA